MKICAISDLHGYLPEIESCELVLICGDIIPLNKQDSYRNTQKWYSKIFTEWANNLPCEKVIFIAGNHDLYLQNHDSLYGNIMFSKTNKITYLVNEEYEYISNDGKIYKIYGTPYCHSFGNWAFMLSDEGLIERYKKIPNDVDILITHDQPYGYGDIILDKDCPWVDGSHIGNIPLRDAILEKQPKYQFNGHLHSCDHSLIKIGETNHYNVSLKNEKYESVYEPLYLEI